MWPQYSLGDCLLDMFSFGAEAGREYELTAPGFPEEQAARWGETLQGFKFWWCTEGQELVRVKLVGLFADELPPPGYLADVLLSDLLT